MLKNRPIAALLSLILLAVIGHSLVQIFGAALAHWQHPTLFNDSFDFVKQGQSSDILGWVVEQHNGHRLIWTKLIVLAETKLFGLVPGQTALFQNMMLLLCSGFLWSWLCSRLLSRPMNRWLTGLAGWAVILNPWQWENIYWEFQPPWFLINCLVLLAALLMSFKPTAGGKNERILLCSAAILPWLAMTSTGQGLAVSFSFCVCAFLYSRRLWLAVTGSTLLAGLSIFVLLPGSSQSSPTFRIDYFLNALLGGAWKGIGILFFVAILIVAIQRYKPSKNILASALMPGLFAGLFAVMITLSRSSLGVEQAESSRYVTHLLMLGLSGLLFLGLSNDKPGKRSALFQEVGVASVLLVTLGSLPQNLLAKGLTYDAAWGTGQYWQRDRELSTICHAANAKVAQYDLQALNLCKPLAPDPPDPNIAYQYFNNELAIKPLGWHQELQSYRLAGLAAPLSTDAIVFHANPPTINAQTVSIEGFASAIHDPQEILFLVAKYGDGSTLVLDAFDGDRRFAKMVPLQFKSSPLLNIQIIGESSRTVIASFTPHQAP